MTDYKKITKDTYNSIAKDYAERDRDSSLPEVPFVTEATSSFARLLPKGAQVLDVGFGGGRDSRTFRSLGFDVTGIDNANKMIETARTQDPSGKYIEMDFENIQFPPNTFDGVWANASLHHVPKKHLPAVLDDIKVALRPRGVLNIIIKHGDKDEMYANFKFGRNVNRYFAYYGQEELAEILKSAGFEIINNYLALEGEWLVILSRKNPSTQK